MKKLAVIWRESVYKNNFVCDRCGEKLAQDDGTIIDNQTERHLVSDMIRCRKCRNIVARCEVVDVPEYMSGLMGSYDEFIGGKPC